MQAIAANFKPSTMAATVPQQASAKTRSRNARKLRARALQKERGNHLENNMLQVIAKDDHDDVAAASTDEQIEPGIVGFLSEASSDQEPVSELPMNKALCSFAAETLLLADIGATAKDCLKTVGIALHGSADVGTHTSSIPLKFLTNDCAVAWEKKTPDGIRIRTACIGDQRYEDLSDFENARSLSRHQTTSVKFVDNGALMKRTIARAEEAGCYYSDSDDSDDDYSYY